MPERAASGHRWYRESEVDLVRRVLLRTCAEVASAAGLAQAPDLLHGLDERPVVAQTDPTRASALFNRAIGYVDRAITSSGRDPSSSANIARAIR